MSFESHHAFDHIHEGPLPANDEALINKLEENAAKVPYPESPSFQNTEKFFRLYSDQVKLYEKISNNVKDVAESSPLFSLWTKWADTFMVVPEEYDMRKKMQENEETRKYLEKFWDAYDILQSYGIKHERRPFGIESVKVGEEEVAITEEKIASTTFGTLLHFKKNFKEGMESIPEQPKVLIVAPLSGHFATLIRDTVCAMLPDHDAYITDWHNPRNVPLSEGPLGVTEYTDSVQSFLEEIGPGAHVLAICQACPETLIATASMAEANNPAVPRSVTLMAGPVDTRINPTGVDKLATDHSVEWFDQTLVTEVPANFVGAGRRVYPGPIQGAAFVSMKPEVHAAKIAHLRELQQNGQGESEEAVKIQEFYDEFTALTDLPAKFYLETLLYFFQHNALQNGYQHHGKVVNFKELGKTTKLFTVEGEKDDICSVGQTVAAHDLCGTDPSNHYVQEGVGHYGVFSGSKWHNEIYPRVKQFIENVEKEKTSQHQQEVYADAA